MGNRVILGKRGSDYGVFVSKEGHNVLNCARKELLFDSTSHRSGLVYAGAKGLNLGDSADNFLTTGSKSSLGYPPLVIITEKNMGERDGTDDSSDSGGYTNQISTWKTTATTVTPATVAPASNNSSGVLSGASPSNGRSLDGVSTAQENVFNASYFVLRIPCAYGYMNSTYFG